MRSACHAADVAVAGEGHHKNGPWVHGSLASPDCWPSLGAGPGVLFVGALLKWASKMGSKMGP